MADIGETITYKYEFTLSTKGPGELPAKESLAYFLSQAMYELGKEFDFESLWSSIKVVKE